MLNRKEIFAILTIALVLGTVVSLGAKDITEWQKIIFPSIGIILLVILINVIAKKIMAYFFDAELEIEIWEWKRYGYKPHQRIGTKYPFGFLMPLIIKFLSFGLLNWMASLTFEVKGTIYRAARKWQMYQYSEVTEDEMAWIAFAGIFMNLVFAILGYMINAPTFARLNLVYAFYNTLPLSNLDGTKMFFGRQSLWWFSAIITSMGVIASMVIM